MMSQTPALSVALGFNALGIQAPTRPKRRAVEEAVHSQPIDLVAPDLANAVTAMTSPRASRHRASDGAHPACLGQISLFRCSRVESTGGGAVISSRRWSGIAWA